MSEFEEVKLEYIDQFKSLNYAEHRKTFNTRIAGVLAIGLWTILGVTVLWHLGSTAFIYYRLWNEEQNIENAIAKVDKSSSLVNDTAKSLYAVIVPIAATVTAFYFDANKRESEADDDSE